LDTYVIAQSSPSTAAAELRFLVVGPDDPLAQPLLSELAVEYSERYGGTPAMHLSWLPVPAAELAPPDGGLLIGLLNGVPVTGGAFRRFDADTAEFKRIWTDSGYRRRGYAKVLLAELEATAAARGYRRVYLITGDRQPEAEAMYRTTGYTEIDAPTVSWGPFRPIAFTKVFDRGPR
jgi:GNAT superfamily N-acetyltransferase